MQESEAADQVMKTSVQASEAAARLMALGARNLAALCLALAKENSQLKGESTLNKLLKSGSALKVVDIPEADLRLFKEKAKQYGVLYTIIKDSRSETGRVDLIAKAEDVSKLNRIFEQLGYGVPELSPLLGDDAINDEKSSLSSSRTLRENQLPLSSNAEEPLKKAQARTRSDKTSPERGNGYRQNTAATSMTKEKSSVKETLEQFKVVIAKQKEDKIRQKQHDRSR